MEVPDNPSDPNEVELTEVDKKIASEKNNEKEPQLNFHVGITFCTHVGWDGVLVMLFSLGIAGLHVYITSLYTKGFHAWYRPGVWVFVVFAILYILVTIENLIVWKQLATRISIDEIKRKKQIPLQPHVVSKFEKIFDQRCLIFMENVPF